MRSPLRRSYGPSAVGQAGPKGRQLEVRPGRPLDL